jgi:hypothetical protein
MGRPTPRARGAKGPNSEFSSIVIVSGVGAAGALVDVGLLALVRDVPVRLGESGDPTRTDIAAMLPSKIEQRQAEITLPLGRNMICSLPPKRA